MVVWKYNSSISKLQIGDMNITQFQEFIHLVIFLTEHGICDIEIRWRIGVVDNAFRNLPKILMIHEKLVSNKERVLNCHIISVFLYGNRYWTVSHRWRRDLTQLWSYRRTLINRTCEHRRRFTENGNKMTSFLTLE